MEPDDILFLAEYLDYLDETENLDDDLDDVSDDEDLDLLEGSYDDEEQDL